MSLKGKKTHNDLHHLFQLWLIFMNSGNLAARRFSFPARYEFSALDLLLPSFYPLSLYLCALQAFFCTTVVHCCVYLSLVPMVRAFIAVAHKSRVCVKQCISKLMITKPLTRNSNMLNNACNLLYIKSLMCLFRVQRN